MNAEQFLTYLQDESHLYSLNYQAFKTLSVQYPYCQNLRLLVVKKSQLDGIDDKEHQQNLTLAAAYLTDRRLLYQKLKQLRETPPSMPILAAQALSLSLATVPTENVFELATLREIEQKRQPEMREILEGEAVSDTQPPLSSSLVATPNLSLADDLGEVTFSLPPIDATNNLADEMLEHTKIIDNQQVSNQHEEETENPISLTDSLATDEELDAILAILSSPDATIQAELEAIAAEKNNGETPILITSTTPEAYFEMVAELLNENLDDTEGRANAPTEPLTVEALAPTVANVADKYDEDLIIDPQKPLPPKPEYARLELSDFTEDYLEREYQLAAEQLAAQQAQAIKLFDDEFGAKLEAINLQEIANLKNEDDQDNSEGVSWELQAPPPPSVPVLPTPKKRVSFDAWLTQFAPSSPRPNDTTPKATANLETALETRLATTPQPTQNGYADENSNILDIDSQHLDPDMRRINLQQLDQIFENAAPLGDLPLMRATAPKNTETPPKKVKKAKKPSTMHILAERSITPDTDLISETLATLLAKQEKNEEARAMYEKLSLKFPEKSVFFAAKIAELKSRS